jgi:endoglucanase
MPVNAPSISSQPSNASIDVGATATFTVTASGVPAPTYQWQYYSGGTWIDISGATGATLTLPNMPASGNGNKYRCVITNEYGSTNSDEVTLSVGGNASVIFSTKYEATVLNWLLFFLGFGWIWMWF